MTAGIQTRNASGVMTLDTTEGIGLYVGSVDLGGEYTGEPYSGTFYVPYWTGVERIWIAIGTGTPDGKPPGGYFTFGQAVPAGGNAVNWSTYLTFRLYYGFY